MGVKLRADCATLAGADAISPGSGPRRNHASTNVMPPWISPNQMNAVW